jgi:hypothetical protein
MLPFYAKFALIAAAMNCASTALAQLDTGRVSLDNLTWSKSGRNNDKIIGSFTLKNDNPFAVRDVYILCHLFDSEGAAFPHSVTSVNETISAVSRQAYRDITMGVEVSPAVARVTCEVSPFKALR